MKAKLHKPLYFWLGIIILAVLILSLFIQVHIPSGTDVIITSLLGILIFYNPIVLAIYIIIALILIILGLKKIKFV